MAVVGALFSLGTLSWVKNAKGIADLGASIVIWPRKKAHKRLPFAKLTGEINAIMRQNYNPVVASRIKTKAMI